MKVVAISLKDSHDRRAYMSAILNHIPFTFFDAENVKTDPHHFIFSLYSREKVKRKKGYELTIPELGCFASHISLWKQCVEDNEPYLILEDNIELAGDLSAQLENIESLVSQYGIVKLGNIFERKYITVCKIDETYNLISNLKGACGTSAYAITPAVASLYLNKVNGFFEPVDDFMDNEWRTGQIIYSYSPPLLRRSDAKSTIGQRKIKADISLISKLNIEITRLMKQYRRKIFNIRKKAIYK
ncbi:glycosyltransferase family 25 protein [Vibrio quintilis]|uniref:Glycosyltransferase family 25 (LPS biosynthesis protein) n=1 Tax=Vibrio quintilis TaxID=1117707 RepID=A0A1M7YNU1_9VIBR|nr:glycosyltransferase family 25 protein [Vibrio quintilis]SHO54333.1 Glycosyltransferase family 25 (LPS biosynthesis protein) [Vibrio quintilis]